MTYQITSWSVGTTTTGKKLARAVLVDPEGNEVDNVTVWGNFPGFDLLAVSNPIEGEITETKNGAYTNKTLNAPRSTVRRTKPDIEKAMDKKAQNISQAQDKKADAIKLAGCNRDATLMVAQELAQMTAFGHEWLQIDAQRKWKEWQSYFMKNYGDGVPFV